MTAGVPLSSAGAGAAELPETRSPRLQTSVRMTPDSINALDELGTTWGMSRDATVRRLLADYLPQQMARRHRDRLTHISTVLRYPPLPPGRNRPDGRVRVAVRLDSWMPEVAERVALRLPGQAKHRGHHDYSRRPLTDAILTALALESPFAISGLEGLPSVITHGAALGLWRLTVAASLTPAEKLAMWGLGEQIGSGGDQAADLKRLLHTGDFSWHHPERFRVALHLARGLLVGADAERNLQMLDSGDQELQVLVADLETDSPESPDSELLRDLPVQSSAVLGRGGAVVWRARRALARKSILEWLSEGSGDQLQLDPPGWTLRLPAGWTAIPISTGPLFQQVSNDVALGLVAKITPRVGPPLGWPYVDGHPVAGFDSYLRGLSTLRPVEVVEATLADAEELRLLFVSADEALSLGLIDQSTRERIVAVAQARNTHAIKSVLRDARAMTTPALLTRLQQAAEDPSHFEAAANQCGIPVRLTPAYWSWSLGEIDDELAVQSAAALTRIALARAAIYRGHLERDMELAARRAFYYGKPPAGEVLFNGTDFGLP